MILHYHLRLMNNYNNRCRGMYKPSMPKWGLVHWWRKWLHVSMCWRIWRSAVPDRYTYIFVKVYSKFWIFLALFYSIGEYVWYCILTECLSSLYVIDVVVACASATCQNGASCVGDVNGTYICVCADGFGGSQCETGASKLTAIHVATYHWLKT